MTTREWILEKAASKLGNYGKGSPQVQAIWRDVLPDMSDAQIKAYAEEASWCGGFVLHCLHTAGVATDVHWQVGIGFVLRVLGTRAATKQPQAADIGIRAGAPGHQVWHHFFVERWGGPNDWHSIDGNTPHCERKHHAALDPTITFYSIDKLLPPMPEGGFVRGQKFSVPGVQD